MERLQRQLMEFEVMESMYPGDDDLTTGSFVVQNPEGVEAVRALVDAWEASGTEPAVEALDALAPLRGSLTLAVPDGDARGTVTLRVALPREYPGSAPALEVSASHLPRRAATEMADVLERFAAALTSDLGEDGGECLMDVAAKAQETASLCAEREERRRAETASSATRGDDEDDADACHAVVRVDHMNDSKGYVRTLQKWCSNLGLDARLFWSEPNGVASAASDATSRPHKSWTSEDVDGEPESAARGVVGPPSGGRVENVFIVVGGDGYGVQKFLTRLRTEFVDVDSKGNKCRERQSTVLCRRFASQTKEGEAPVPAFAGFECEKVVGGNRALEGILKRFNLLHVGTGAERFQATGGG